MVAVTAKWVQGMAVAEKVDRANAAVVLMAAIAASREAETGV